MKLIINIFLIAVTSLLISSCSKEDNTTYETAAEPLFSISASVVETGDLVAFTDTSNPSNGETLVSWAWDFGENATSTSTLKSPTYRYTKEGTYTVRLTVESSNGRKSTAKSSIVVNIPYRAQAHALFTVAEKANMNVELPFTDTSEAAENATITAWEWSFGDGSEKVITQNPKHTYTKSGNFTVSLKVTDSKGNMSTKTKDINVIDPADLVTIDWRTALGGVAQNTVSPAMSPDGNTIYAWADQSVTDAYDVALRAYNVATGAVKWSYNANNELAAQNTGGGVRQVFCSPAVGPTGDIYMAARDLRNTGAARKSFLFAVKADGTKKWTYAFGLDVNFNYMTPAIDADGKIYVGHLTTAPFAIAVLNPTNGTVDKSIPSVATRSGISLSKAGNVYVCTIGANGMYSYSYSSAAQDWQYNTNYKTTGGAISIATDGTVYNVASGDSQQIVSATTPLGAQKWEAKTAGNSNYGGAVIGADGTVYVNGGNVVAATASAGVYALKASDGTTLWHFPTEENVSNCTPLVDNRGYVHFITDKGTYYVVTDEGALYGKKSLGTASVSSPVMNAAGKVSIIAHEGTASFVYCLSTGATSYATSAWPMRNGNQQRTGLQK